MDNSIIVSFYTFGFWTEFILFPFLVFIGAIQAVASFDAKNKPVEELFKKVSAIAGLIILGYVGYKTFVHTKHLFTIENLKSFLLPIILSFLFVPFVYFVALYAEYESLFVRLNFLVKEDPSFKKALKAEILKVANFDLDKLLNISKNIAKMLLVDESHSLDDIKRISKKSE